MDKCTDANMHARTQPHAQTHRHTLNYTFSKVLLSGSWLIAKSTLARRFSRCARLWIFVQWTRVRVVRSTLLRSMEVNAICCRRRSSQRGNACPSWVWLMEPSRLSTAEWDTMEEKETSTRNEVCWSLVDRCGPHNWRKWNYGGRWF